MTGEAKNAQYKIYCTVIKNDQQMEPMLHSTPQSFTPQRGAVVTCGNRIMLILLLTCPTIDIKIPFHLHII